MISPGQPWDLIETRCIDVALLSGWRTDHFAAELPISTATTGRPNVADRVTRVPHCSLAADFDPKVRLLALISAVAGGVA